MSEERKAAALRIIRRAKRAGLARDRAYSTSEGGTNHLPLVNGGAQGGLHNQRNGGKNSRKSRSGFGRGLPKKGIVTVGQKRGLRDIAVPVQLNLAFLTFIDLHLHSQIVSDYHPLF